MTRYASGRRIEYKAIEQLKAEGAVYAGRTAGSHTKFDVIAVFADPPHSRWIQCKSGCKATINRERKNWIPPELPPFHYPFLYLWETGRGKFEIIKKED